MLCVLKQAFKEAGRTWQQQWKHRTAATFLSDDYTRYNQSHTYSGVPGSHFCHFGNDEWKLEAKGKSDGLVRITSLR